ncbi:trichoplein keratin filament-binding protein [Puma concolor]|uniref:Trichoplein keratin filament-binding protein n=1 Tax=Puma concolor TaxID=9696 RepID=A0A6P6INE6_PUMCO|nr:trichoplein keratin filament-binding protein [Puma concolor]
MEIPTFMIIPIVVIKTQNWGSSRQPRSPRISELLAYFSIREDEEPSPVSGIALEAAWPSRRSVIGLLPRQQAAKPPELVLGGPGSVAAGPVGLGWGMRELGGGSLRELRGAEKRESGIGLGRSRRGGPNARSPAAVARCWREPRRAPGDRPSSPPCSLRILGPFALQSWDQNSRYFKMSDICSSKQAEWSSQTSYQRSMHAYQREKLKEEKRKQLEARRERLRQLLLEEQALLARQLEELRLNMDAREGRLRERHGDLKSAREEQRKLIAEQLLYEHWKKNNPKLREIESALHKEHVINSWKMQKEEKKQQEATQEEENKRYENEYERARREALERMKAEEEKRRLEGKLQAEALLQQVEELKLKELEATKLKKEQENLLKQRWELERLEEERKQMAAFRQKAELGRFLRHQYNVQLNRRAQQIQEELHLARREQAVADAAWMKQAIEEQLQLEREREAELQLLLREEAKEMWEKREAEWARERSARDRLMSEVLTGRQQQIQAKLEQNRRAQEESLRRREQLIRNLEEVRESARREKEESKELKSARKQELEAQVAERQLRVWEEDQQEEEEEEEARQAEQFTDALLQQEVKTMAKQGSWPKPYGHPRIAWN